MTTSARAIIPTSTGEMLPRDHYELLAPELAGLDPKRLMQPNLNLEVAVSRGLAAAPRLQPVTAPRRRRAPAGSQPTCSMGLVLRAARGPSRSVAHAGVIAMA